MTWIPQDSVIGFLPDLPNEGGWVIGGNWTVYVTKRPTDEQIKNTQELLGWEWVEAEIRGEK
jgi:hypothetical protein